MKEGIATLFLLACIVPAGFAVQVARPAPQPPVRDPVHRILCRRAELGLTTEQVLALERIERRMLERRTPLLERLAAVRRGGRPVAPETGALLRELRRVQYRAQAEAREVLTLEQNALAWPIFGEAGWGPRTLPRRARRAPGWWGTDWGGWW